MSIRIEPCPCGCTDLVEEEPMWVVYHWVNDVETGLATISYGPDPRASIEGMDSIWRCLGCRADRTGPVEVP